MDFELSEEQRMFRDAIRDFVAKEITPVAQQWEREGRYDDLKALYEKWVINTPGYYKGAKARFVQHSIGCLKEIANVDITQNNGFVFAKEYPELGQTTLKGGENGNNNKC